MAYLGPPPARTPVTSDQITDASVVTAKLASPLVTPGIVDMNGAEFILDADGDTTIHSNTDDQIDIKIAGADDFNFTANTLNILSGSTLAINSGATIANSGTYTGFGKLVGIKCVSTATATTTTGSSFTDATNVTIDYTQAASANYVLVTVSGTAWATGSLDQRRPVYVIAKDGSAVAQQNFNQIATASGGNAFTSASLCLQYYGSGASTSAITYKLQLKCTNADTGTTAGFNQTVSGANAAVISVLEFAV